ncbi:molybdopterin molybdotransferase MoeA [Chitinophaga nivalis]|uniref:Molybdopterin molybdenumtransferase n=1 Tax=Chitinophaga nivalis TaxID=2991709 RepID=A0ABT3IUN2_9BACT|nr:molybdopterin molybdotransferase MoeA [Chitinophaga nivalis]MCW3462890.1 molybdopterin molybdotransferase MoeA [Chitinophaga nivalis]MCW3487420.1 molybdopterin molybdotransferase MoeA [Chitinophaga nivalis]
MMLSVAAAFTAVMQTVRDTDVETISFEMATGRVLREPVAADRPFPPFNRIAMDGIAVNYDSFARGQHIFGVEDIQAAGTPQLQLSNTANCIEVMTGAILPEMTDTVIPYEQLTIAEHDGFRRFTIVGTVKKGQHIHTEGSDVAAGAVLLQPGTLLGPAEAGVLASVGKTTVQVSRLPRVVVMATGNELVPVGAMPEPHQIRMSNVYSLVAALQQLGLPVRYIHLPDDKEAMEEQLRPLLYETDVWISSGAVSAGKYDYLPAVLQQLGMQTIFHKVQQRPGKPFLFGAFENGPVVFALPGNPVSGFMCFYRYVQPWLQAAMGLTASAPAYAVLGAAVSFEPALEYYLPVKLTASPDGSLVALPQPYHGSGDLASLLQADGFLALPADTAQFQEGNVYPLWRFR